ncbi:cytochrome c oxidase subunit II [Isorropodon fossajaponicum endosymbiont JTNG4]|uniref:cytochrome c oxidase subunit II n=1 Tax=Isorropodon fossajaponicum symbiont TaxID=883811 RepID=UPI001915B848|nr:cytochrome c oxidase subunit II [Isorropodon fossajaponicum symbiont]BBB23734.1 cytochrome c oxidase subunit II [Isorropodon fossajaponicum endosymbiont JTNG4]
MSKLTSRLVGGLIAIVSENAFAEYGFNMTQGVTSVSRDIYGLHTMVFWICVAIAVIVFGVMIYSLIVHRKSQGAVAANFHESTKVELLWTGVPIIILVLMVIPASTVLIDLEDTSKAQMTIKITGHQWKWQYDYPKEGISFISNLKQDSKDVIYSGNRHKNYLLEVDNNLVLPVDTSIRFLITSNDVIHSWWVPDFGVKQDANPGFINDAWVQIDEIGTYRGQCAELCGKDHGFMPIVVDVVSKADYAKWVLKQQAAKAATFAKSSKTWREEELISLGQKVYNTNCSSCHGITGKGIPGVFPALKGSSIATGDIKKHISIVLHGKAGTAMASYKNILGDADIAAVITFERAAFGNQMGDLIQPVQIKAAR